MKPHAREWQWAAALTAAGAVGLAFLYAVDPERSHLYPPCPLFFLSGLQCPGCGTARALHQLLHGHLAAAWRFNALVVALLPTAAYALLARGLTAAGSRLSLPVPRTAGWAWLLLGAALVFGVFRNLPLSGLLSPVP